VASVLEDLRWLGIDWDEGPGADGGRGPYRQSERTAVYREHLKRLLDAGKAYPCYCRREEIEAQRAEAVRQKRTFIYPGTCRDLDADERRRREAEGRKPCYRLRVPSETITQRDLIRGPVSIHTRLFGDWVLVRPDGSPTYNFAVVVDDALMGITHVVRGEDHLPNTPKQIALFQALGYPLPAFAHLSMILGPDGAKLSKRHGDVSLDAFRKKGFLPDAVINGLALLGWSDESGEEVLTRDRIIEGFRLDRIHKAAATFDETKLLYLNREHLKALSDDALANGILPHLRSAGRLPEGSLPDEVQAWLRDVAAMVRSRIDLASDAVAATGPVWEFDPDAMAPEAEKVLAAPDAATVIRALAKKVGSTDMGKAGAYREVALALRDELPVKGKALFHPIRVALTAAASGPDLEALVPVLAAGSALDLPRPVLSPEERVKRILDRIS